MTFTSLNFVVFFIVVFFIYWNLSRSHQNIFLLAASFFFYGFLHPWFSALLFGTLTIDYLSALAMKKWPQEKRAFLWLSLAGNLGTLAAFKYFDFFSTQFTRLFSSNPSPAFSAVADFILPVGISFYTLQALSYTIDVYRGDFKPQKSFIDFALYVSFFPQLLSGPIERAEKIFPQLQAERKWQFSDFSAGLILVAVGYFKKLVIADNLSPIANKIFALNHPDFAMMWVGVFAFGFQIYADFSGYTDIARGLAKLLGFNLSINFKNPYLAKNPSDFWRRWHISLSSWIRDYLYIPLGGSRGGMLRTSAIILITFGISGLWHGASWNFVIWGFYHGLLLIFYRFVVPASFVEKNRVLAVFLMFIFVHIGWLFFREESFHHILLDLRLNPFELNLNQIMLATVVFSRVLFYSSPLWLEMFMSEKKPSFGFQFQSDYSRAVLVGILLTAILIFRSFSSGDFIYYQF